MTTQPTDSLSVTRRTSEMQHAGVPATLLLTLELSEPAQSLFQALRNRHFPPERNLVPAHVSLFHTLPGAERGGIVRLLRSLDTARPQILVEPPRSLGHGVAFRLASAELQALRGRLAAAWSEWLTPQDRQRFQPHITVQNKVTPGQAAATLARLQNGFAPWPTEGVALLLWRYLDGPWQAIERFELAPAAQAPPI